MSLAAVLALGFFLGMRHATDADHVVAVSTIVSRQRTLRAAAPIGMLWGVGHTLTILLVGGAIILFGIVIPPRLGLGMELSVALMLVLLGSLNVRSVLRDIRALAGHQSQLALSSQVASAAVHTEHVHAEHAHAEHVHHGHSHAAFVGERRHSHTGAHEHVQQQGRPSEWGAGRLRPLFVGIVHGLAGSAAVALLVLGAINDAALGIAYLLVFGAGTIAGMVLITSALAVPLAAAAQRFAGFHRLLGVATGLASVIFGAMLVYEIGFVDGLFRSEVHWSPR